MKLIRSNTLLIVDASAVLHRRSAAMHSSMTEKKFKSKNTVSGLMDIIVSCSNAVKGIPSQIAVALDHHLSSSSRRSIDNTYKRNRQDPHYKYILDNQRECLLEFCSLASIPIVSPPNFEADDAIATLTANWTNNAPASSSPFLISPNVRSLKSTLKSNFEGEFDADKCEEYPLVEDYSSMIIAGIDKDLYPLIDGQNRFFFKIHETPGKLYDFTTVCSGSYEGIPARRIHEFLALAGDASDGFMGAKNIGEKKAKLILNYYDIQKFIIMMESGVEMNEALALSEVSDNSSVRNKDQKALDSAIAIMKNDIESVKRCFKLATLNSNTPGCLPLAFKKGSSGSKIWNEIQKRQLRVQSDDEIIAHSMNKDNKFTGASGILDWSNVDTSIVWEREKNKGFDVWRTEDELNEVAYGLLKMEASETTIKEWRNVLEMSSGRGAEVKMMVELLRGTNENDLKSIIDQWRVEAGGGKRVNLTKKFLTECVERYNFTFDELERKRGTTLCM